MRLYYESTTTKKGEKMMQGCMSSMMGNEPVVLSEGLAQLKNEHIPLLEKLHGLFDLCSKIEKEGAAPDLFAQLKPAVEAFMKELDPHSEREEQVLFRLMENYLGVGMGPIAVMEYEHDQAKTMIAKFFEKINNANGDLSQETILECVSLIKNAHFTLVDHFAKEENVLFPMAERMLSYEEKKELYEKINQI
jgi:regulator of cell morphogenesis and NO signaling